MQDYEIENEISSSDEELEEKKIPKSTSEPLLDFTKPKIVIAVGGPSSGKTNLIKHLILSNSVQKKIFKFGLVFTGTGFDSEYDYIDNKNAKVPYYTKEAFLEYIKKLKKMSMKKKLPPNFIVLDDLLGVVQRDDVFNRFAANHRHYNTTIFITAQYLKAGISSTLRSILSYAFLFATKDGLSLQSLHESFFRYFRKPADFERFFHDATKEDYTCVLYRPLYKDPKDMYKIYKAPNVSKDKTRIKF